MRRNGKGGPHVSGVETDTLAPRRGCNRHHNALFLSTHFVIPADHEKKEFIQ